MSGIASSQDTSFDFWNSKPMQDVTLRSLSKPALMNQTNLMLFTWSVFYELHVIRVGQCCHFLASKALPLKFV